jgi:hypothetical protein
MFERRHSDRLEIPKAKVVYKTDDGITFNTTLKDMTISSIRFESNNYHNVGEFIEMEIIIPGKEKIQVKGKVIRVSNYYITVQFLLFGSDERYNSMNSYEQLKELSEEYLQTVE